MISQKLVDGLEGAAPCIQVKRRCSAGAGGRVIGFVIIGCVEVAEIVVGGSGVEIGMGYQGRICGIESTTCQVIQHTAC